MQGGAGDDTYVVDNVSDTVFENMGAGIDLVRSGISFVLGSSFENLTLTGAALEGRGNIFANVIKGSGVANKLFGLGGSDTLLGEAGNDRLKGGKGHDELSGGLGRDKLIGNGGRDKFVFDTALGGGNVDNIKGFKSKKDKVWLDEEIFSAIGGKLGKGEFEVGKRADDANDYVIFNEDNRKLFYDVNGDASGGKVAFGKLGKGVALTHRDFAMVEDFAV
jgi:Ca2+-binding RTX toxin-like protein